MHTTKLSSKGQIILPKWLRDAYNWEPGQEFQVIDTGEGALLKPKRPFPPTTVADVAGCLTYAGENKTVEEMETAVGQGLAAGWHDRS